MTLLETERLIRKLSELLRQRDNPDGAPKFAADYSAACHAANLRLQQCEAMIKAGDRPQALQLAETAPSLLDVITLLEFRGADEWRAFCQQNALPTAERIDARSVQVLNAVYAQGITTDHPLYAAYRKAVLSRNDEDALKTLQAITRLNPGDENAAAELARLDAKVLAARLQNLGDVLSGGDAPLVAAAVEAIEAFGFKTSPAGAAWSRAQTIRCGCVLDEAGRLKAVSQWSDVLAKLDFIRRLQTDFKLDLPSADVTRLADLETWARGEQERDRRDREFHVLLGELRFKVQQSEEKDTSSRYVQLPELRDDFEGLHKVWRSLADFTRIIPEDATNAFRKRSALLEAEIARRTALRLRGVLAGSLAALVVGGILVWFVLGQLKAREFAAGLRAAVSQRQVRAAERLLEHIHNEDKKLLSVGSVNTAAGAAETFVTKEHALWQNFETAFAKLPAQLGGEPDAAQLNAMADKLVQAQAAWNDLAPDLKTENEPRVRAFEKQWQEFLAEDSAAVNHLLEQWIGGAERQAAELDYREPVETAAAQVSALGVVVRKIDDCEAGFTNQVSLRSDLLQRGSAVRAKFAAYGGELKKLDEGMADLKKARTWSEFTPAINLIASTEFSDAPLAKAAIAAQALGASDDIALRSLLGMTNAATWAFVRKHKGTGLVPEIAMPAEGAFFQELNADPAVNAQHQEYRLWLDRENTKSVEWITAGVLDSSPGWKNIKAWTQWETENHAGFEDREYGFFDGQWKLSATQPVFKLEKIGERKEASAFGTAGINKVWSGGSTYGGPLLAVLDAVKDSGDGSPVFRAYLFCRLVDVMEFQPDAWGLSFCPSARADAAQIHKIVGGVIASGDWFVSSKTNLWAEKLDQFFSSQKSVSYVKQAAGNLALAEAVTRDGVRYAGFAGLDGKPVLSGDAPPAELWGYDGARKQPVRVTDSALPLSPLFALSAPRGDYLTAAGIGADDPSFTNALPPVFRATKP